MMCASSGTFHVPSSTSVSCFHLCVESVPDASECPASGIRVCCETFVRCQNKSMNEAAKRHRYFMRLRVETWKVGRRSRMGVCTGG